MHKSVPFTEKRPRWPETGVKDHGSEEIEHEFPFRKFRKFRPEKQDYLFSCSAALADFPRERPIFYFPNGFSGNFFSCIMILYFPNGFSANFFQNDNQLLPRSFSWHHPLSVKCFHFTALIFVYDFHPGAETLLMKHFSGPDSNLGVGPDGSLLFPSTSRPLGVHSRHRPGHRSPMPERLIWSYIIQLSSALRTVHAAGLACRVIDPSKILLIGNSR